MYPAIDKRKATQWGTELTTPLPISFSTVVLATINSFEGLYDAAFASMISTSVTLTSITTQSYNSAGGCVLVIGY